MVKQVLTALLFIAIGSSAVFVYYATQNQEKDQCAYLYPLTSADLNCDEYAESRDTMTHLNDAIRMLASQSEQRVEIDDVSVWVRNLTTRQWAAYNEHKTYTPASLMKLPLMLAYYKQAELEPAILQKELTYSDTEANDGNILPSKTLVVGVNYKIEELIEEMIRYSDNYAMRVLFNNIDPSVMAETLQDVGIQIINQEDTFNYVTPKTYGNIFRVLHNASYLDRDNSQKALTLLTSVEYKGMTAPLPSTVKVAHKFGEREVKRDDGTTREIQLHDCGIIYKNPHPYSLCIMTRGKDFKMQQTIIEEISKLVYDSI